MIKSRIRIAYDECRTPDKLPQAVLGVVIEKKGVSVTRKEFLESLNSRLVPRNIRAEVTSRLRLVLQRGKIGENAFADLKKEALQEYTKFGKELNQIVEKTDFLGNSAIDELIKKSYQQLSGKPTPKDIAQHVKMVLRGENWKKIVRDAPGLFEGGELGEIGIEIRMIQTGLIDMGKIKTPKDRRDWHYTALSLEHDEKDSKAALRAIKKADKQSPNDWVVWHNMGNVLLSLKKYRKAALAFNRAIELNTTKKSELYASYHGKGLALKQLGKHKEAIREFNTALKQKPDFYQGLFSKAEAFYNLKKYGVALVVINEALKVRPTSCNSLNLKGDILNCLGRKDSAKTFYEKATRLKNKG
ncbi:MAG: tetratricopeptide repeat protein [archaeon]